jgi:hypothetical protein
VVAVVQDKVVAEPVEAEARDQAPVQVHRQAEAADNNLD